MSTGILFFGDAHGHFEHVAEVVERHSPAAIVFLGDLQAQRPLHEELRAVLDRVEIWYIHGNHDTDAEATHDHLFRSELSHRNLHGRVVSVAGVRIAGLGGVFRGQVWNPHDGPPRFKSAAAFLKRYGKGNRWRGGLPVRHRSTIFPDVVDHLAQQQADVLVTHEAPSCHPHGFSDIDQLARRMGVRAVFHGHHHDRLDYRAHAQRMGFRAYGVGYCGVVDLDGELVREGEFDAAGHNRHATGYCL